MCVHVCHMCDLCTCHYVYMWCTCMCLCDEHTYVCVHVMCVHMPLYVVCTYICVMCARLSYVWSAYMSMCVYVMHIHVPVCDECTHVCACVVCTHVSWCGIHIMYVMCVHTCDMRTNVYIHMCNMYTRLCVWYVYIFLCVSVCLRPTLSLISVLTPYSSSRTSFLSPGNVNRIAGPLSWPEDCSLILTCQPALVSMATALLLCVCSNCYWICPSYFIFLLKILSVYISGASPDFLAQRAFCGSVPVHLWLLHNRSIVLQTQQNPFPHWVRLFPMPSHFPCAFPSICECPLP